MLYTPRYKYQAGRQFNSAETDWALHTNGMGFSDSKVGTLSLWIRPNASILAGTAFFSYQTAGSSPKVAVLISSNKLWVVGRGTDTNIKLEMLSNTAITTTRWTHFLAAWDLAAGYAKVRRNGVDDTTASPTIVNANIDHTTDNYQIGANGGTFPLNACLCHFWFSGTTKMDIDDPAIIREFYSPDGLPGKISPTDGSTATHGQPWIYLPNGDPTNNVGTTADYVMQGGSSLTTVLGPAHRRGYSKVA